MMLSRPDLGSIGPSVSANIYFVDPAVMLEWVAENKSSGHLQ
jgi:hypothetical protein